eukprot:COSAG06_NODE_612_length_13800_cov_14.100650_4_plen_236_part_00
MPRMLLLAPLSLLAVLLLAATRPAVGVSTGPLGRSGAELALPSPQQLHFQRQPIGCFFHFGINTFAGAEHGSLDEVPSMFDAPADLDTDQWARSCAALGGTYAVFTAKHEEGLMNWPSNASNYTIESSPFCVARRKAGRSCDLVREFLDSCDKYNLSRGIYYTLVNAQCQRSASGWAPGLPVNATNCTLPSVVPEWLRQQSENWKLNCCQLMLRNGTRDDNHPCAADSISGTFQI